MFHYFDISERRRHICEIYNIYIIDKFGFVYVQQYVPPQIAGAGHACSDRSLFYVDVYLS